MTKMKRYLHIVYITVAVLTMIFMPLFSRGKVFNVVDMEPEALLVEGEYIYKYYTNDAFEACHAYNFMANYFMPVKMGVFNQLSFHGRFDGMTDHSTGKRNSAGFLEIDDNARNRVTIGATLSYILPKVKTDVRVNYENYFYRDGIVAPAGDRDKILVELVVRF